MAVVLVMCVAIFGTLLTVGVADSQAREDAQVKTTDKMATDIKAVLESAGSTVSTLAEMDEIITQAQAPATPDSPDALSILTTSKATLNASIVYVMDVNGTVIACSPYGDGKTLTGKNYVFRPYFLEAINGTEVLYLAVGATTGARGIYHSYPIIAQAGPPIGVVVIKMGLEEIDAIIQEETSLLLSPDGIVLAASNADWLYKIAFPITANELETIEDSQQFANEDLTPLGATLDKETATLDGKEYSVVRTPLAIEGWSIVTLEESSIYPIVTAIMNSAIILVIGVLVILILVMSSKKKTDMEQEGSGP